MPIQQQSPIISGLPPVLISLTISVLRPMAAMASTMKNLDSSFIGANTSGETPADTATVVMTEAAIKYKMKKGKICLILTFSPSAVCPFFVFQNARHRVMGMMARVLVSFTVTALSRVAEPRFHMLSQVEAQAVTEEVSLTAVPAKIPKASPEAYQNRRRFRKKEIR